MPENGRMSSQLQLRTSQRNTVTPLDVASVLWVFTHGLCALFYSPAPQLGVPVSQCRFKSDDVIIMCGMTSSWLCTRRCRRCRRCCRELRVRQRVKENDPLSASKCSTIHCSLTTVQCAHWRWIVILAVIVVDKLFLSFF